MIGFTALNAVLIGVLLAMSGSCSSPPSKSATTPPVSATPAPVQQSVTEAQAGVREEHPDVTVVRFANEPFALLSVEVDAKRPQITLQTQNVSGKTVRLVTYGLVVSPRCSQFMYSPGPDLLLGYGDWSARQAKSTNRSNPPIKPQEKATIVVDRDKSLITLLSAKTYETCPAGYKKPELMIQNVYFDDGTEWRPNQR